MVAPSPKNKTRERLGLLFNLVVEFGPLVLFLVMFEFFNFQVATIILVVTTVVVMVSGYVVQKRIALFPLFASGSVVVFGLATIFLKDANFIIIKDSLFYGIFGSIIIVSLLMNRLVLKDLFFKLFAISDRGWKIVSWRWGIFMILLAVSNEIFRIGFSEEIWVRYKTYALFVLFIFSAYQMLLSRKERTLDKSNAWGFRIFPD
ncbi:MAG: septation protein IspZ [Candidatus Pacebacteria bacterium]|nr:septation protein IspZ [Candidatus Paceibacterota bacterium]